MFDNQLVSVITPAYNASKFISKTIDSVVKQTYKDIELIIVDDKSTDNTVEIIREYQKTYPFIRLFEQEVNAGAAVARNTAMSKARGRYLAFLDSDDVWLSDKLEKQLSQMKNTGSVFSFAAIEMIDEDGNLLKSHRHIPKSVDYRFLLKNTAIATSSVLLDRNAFANFTMPLRRSGQDYATWLQLLRNGVVARGIDEVLVQYRVSSNSLSSNKFKSVKQVFDIQTKDENISKIKASMNCIAFAWNAFKKHFL